MDYPWLTDEERDVERAAEAFRARLDAVTRFTPAWVALLDEIRTWLTVVGWTSLDVTYNAD